MKHPLKRRLLILGSVCSMLLFLTMAGFAYRWYQVRQSRVPNEALAEVYQKGMYAEDRPVLSFSDKVFDFGTVATGASVEHTYLFMNAGKKPLMIHQVLGGGCSDCVTKVWPEQPIQPGEQGEIKIKLNSTDQEGKQAYVIVVRANTDPSETRLLFKGVLVSPNKQ